MEHFFKNYYQSAIKLGHGKQSKDENERGILLVDSMTSDHGDDDDKYMLECVIHVTQNKRNSKTYFVCYIIF